MQEVQLVTVVQNGIGDTPALQNGAYLLVGIRGGEHTDDLNAFIGVFLTDFLEGGQFIDARAAPRLPEIQNGQSMTGENLLGDRVAIQVSGIKEKFRGEGHIVLPPQGKLPDVDVA